ncbi:unnamed protein product [Auanema sp. JU1783]|nr:unnamed protein product [Auanema sp. JU1783]
MKETPEDIFLRIQQAVRSDREHDIEYIQEILKLIQQLLLLDFEFALLNKVEVLIWNVMRETIEPVRLAKSKGLQNVLNMCVAFLSDLCILLQAEYGVIFEFVPSFISLSSAITHKSRNNQIREPTIRTFCHFVSLRLGDIFRYKDELVLAENCYKTAIRADPSNGSVWNQMSLIAQYNAKFADKLYYSARAVHTERSFESATTNTASLLKKFAEGAL